MSFKNYSYELLEDLKVLDWPENIKKIQDNLIGKSEKYLFTFDFKETKYYLNLDKPSDIFRLKAVGIHAFSKLRRKGNTIFNQEGIGKVKNSLFIK